MYALSMPIEELLENGSVVVTGTDIADAKASTPEEAERLASVIRIGSLKLELELVEEINR